MKRRVALLRSLNRPTEAITALIQLLDAVPTDAEGWCELADLYQSQGLGAQAIFSLEEALLIAPNSWNVWLHLSAVTGIELTSYHRSMHDLGNCSIPVPHHPIAIHLGLRASRCNIFVGALSFVMITCAVSMDWFWYGYGLRDGAWRSAPCDFPLLIDACAGRLADIGRHHQQPSSGFDSLHEYPLSLEAVCSSETRGYCPVSIGG